MVDYPDSKFAIIVLGDVNGAVLDQLVTQLGALAHGDAVTLTSKRKEIALPDGHAGQIRRRLRDGAGCHDGHHA